MSRTIVITREQNKAFKEMCRDAGRVPLGDSEERMLNWIMKEHGTWTEKFESLNEVDKKCLIRMALGEDYEVHSRVGKILKVLLNQYEMYGSREKDFMIEYAIKQLETEGLLTPEAFSAETEDS